MQSKLQATDQNRQVRPNKENDGDETRSGKAEVFSNSTLANKS